jgi:hypothetical protein
MAFVPLGQSQPAVNKAPSSASFYGGGILTSQVPQVGGDTPPPASSSAPSAPYAGLSSFGPGNDLQGTQITPQSSPMTAQAQGYAAGAAGQVAGQSFNPWQSMSPFTSSAAGQYQGIAPLTAQTGGTTDPTAAYGYQNKAEGALSGGAMGAGMETLIGLSGGGGGFSYGGPGADVGKARGMKKNTASQVVVAQLVSKTDGSAVTSGTTTVYVLGDGGTQATGTVGSGAATHEGNGVWSYAPAQAETNYDHVAFTFVNTSAVNATVQVYTSFPQTGDNYARLGAPAGASVSADVAAVKAVLPAALVSGRIDASVGAMASGVLTATAIAADAITDAKVASDVTIASVTGAVGSVT